LHAAYLLMNDHLLVKSVKHMLLTWVAHTLKKGKFVPVYAMQAKGMQRHSSAHS
jgi:hypothetical protein